MGLQAPGLAEEATVVATPSENTVTLQTPRPDALQGDQPAAAPADEAPVVLQAAEDVAGSGADDAATMQLNASGVPPDDSQTVALPTIEAGADLPEATVILEVESDASATAATLPPTPTKGVPRPLPVTWVLGGAAILFVLAASAVVWLLLSRGRAVEPELVLPSAAPVADVSKLPTVGTLLVESEPSGADVTVNGEARGTTPLELEVELALKGYAAQSHDMVLSAESPTAELQATLSKRRPTTGTANFASVPAGAAVYVDGKQVGTTPLNGVRLRPGEHDVSLILEAHERWSGAVKVVAGRRARVKTELVPIPEAPPTPEPVDTARIYENTDGDVDRIARKRSGDAPSYPTDRVPRLKSGERVSVTLTFLVNAEGGGEDVEVTESAGKAVDDVVVAAVRTWTYDPATIRETPVKMRIRFRQTFLGG